MTQKILLVEDEKLLRHNLKRHLTNRGHEVVAVEDGRSALKLIDDVSFDILLTDLRLPDLCGSELIQRAMSVSPSTVSLLMTAYGTLDTAISVFRNGAQDYILKPFSLKELDEKIDLIIISKQQLMEEVHLRHVIQPEAGGGTEIKGVSPQIKQINRLIDKIAATPSTVLVTGDSGTGKGVVARMIHQHSHCSEDPFVAVNVAAIPDGLLESYLFGHVRGSFTGANQGRDGAFRTASGGTLLLDEIGEMSLDLQPKLLRAIEEHEVLPVGSDTTIKVNLRLISATNRNLKEMVERGEFREDLFYRLNIVNIHIPPLRERFDDIPVLVEYLLGRFRRDLEKPTLSVDSEVMRYLMNQPWHGNIRELANTLERAAVFCDGRIIKIEDLTIESVEEVEPELVELSEAVEQFKYKHILSILESVGGNRELAAKKLGLSPATLYRHLERLGLKGHRSKAKIHLV